MLQFAHFFVLKNSQSTRTQNAKNPENFFRWEKNQKENPQKNTKQNPQTLEETKSARIRQKQRIDFFWILGGPRKSKILKKPTPKTALWRKQTTKGKKHTHTHTHTDERQKPITNILETEITQTCAGGRGGNPSISGYGEESEQEGQSYNSNCSSCNCNCNTSVSNPIHHLLHNTQHPKKKTISPLQFVHK